MLTAEIRTNATSTKPVERAAKGLLLKTGYPALKTVECSFHDGTMTLRGRVPSYFHKQLAQEVLRDIAHVNEVANQIKVSNARVLSVR